jgi:hypothetical protein
MTGLLIYKLLKAMTPELFFLILRCDKQGIDLGRQVTALCSNLIVAVNKFDKVLDLTNNPDSLIIFRYGKTDFSPIHQVKVCGWTTRSGIFYYDISEGSVLSYNNRPGDSLFAKRSATALSISPSGNIVVL